jgi:rSAM/selenodomain-associated transferase 1
MTCCIAIFARTPVKGFVKTRLSRDLDEIFVVNLYKNFILDTLLKIKSIKIQYKIFFDPPGTENLMSSWLGADNDFNLQQGNDLGERMQHAFESMFESTVSKGVIVGTDLPDLPVKYIYDALDGLEKNNAVIGPSADGGYYLIGFNKESFNASVFEQMPWGGKTVFDDTMALFKKAKLSVHVLSKWRDVDTYEDFIALTHFLKNNPDAAPATFQYLNNAGLIDMKSN